jgi:hypothetical protein
MTAEAIAKIDAGMLDSKETKVSAEPIAKFLRGKCSEDDFAALVSQEHKTLDKCFAFVYEQVQKHLNRRQGWIDDNEVYAMAVDYFNLDDAEIERRKAEDAQKAEEERQRRDAESKKKAEEAKELKAKEAKHKAFTKQVNEGQMSLFGEVE